MTCQRPLNGLPRGWRNETFGEANRSTGLVKNDDRAGIMAASYTVKGDSFKADKPRVWSEQAIQPLHTQRYSISIRTATAWP